MTEPRDNPFLDGAAPYPNDPAFISFALEERFDSFWRHRESQWRANGIAADRSDYVDLYISQHGRCGVCDLPYAAFSRGLALDHNHVTGALRGLLCGLCNYRLGVADTIAATTGGNAYTPKQAAYLRGAARRIPTG
jgi:Recombination endonuclease VII